MLERLSEQRLPVQAVLADETVTKVGIRRSLAMRECQWELVAQLIPVLRPLAKNTVRNELITRFKLLSRLLAESIPITARTLDPRFKHLKLRTGFT
ncbi:hypothetical protein NHX12_029370 [Muraenolepis orangiensis]|uniref:Uncharacterized protein n=1 Tax=Muraenolepis orangiensis TaxID=630683 RepID=A0A9Q0ING6_9TELE|nr:hypothetical protein NHX12_029370 [Muraenolepis orangiensis]